MYDKIDRYIERLLDKSTPEAPYWNIESIRQGKPPHWNYIDGCMITALLCAAESRAQYNREYFFWMGRRCVMENDYQAAIRTLNTLLRFDEDAHEG